MANSDPISRLAQQIGERLQGASHAPEEIQRSVQSVLRGAVDRLELVSREDFDILMDVLQRTRTRVETLERQVAALEARMGGEALPEADPIPDQEAASDKPPAEDAGAGEVSESGDDKSP
ncbi:accessory factor UbiK family protein [Aidingimonas lacisalsi]|uniref:accessory factor UbiK family protein n=1 Tax=Aidingimonas lacisalsi TaxID=2604086 RepID=UPI0011D18DD2|nr:accessory factor UbiK family protein [Aidingimonas lacisalsi]